MNRDRLLAVLSALAICALLVLSKPELPSGPDLQWALIQASQIVMRGRGENDQSSPAQPLGRVSQSGHDYGECSGVISTVLLFPEPCDGVWQRRPRPFQQIHD